MTIESATSIGTLIPANPAASDPRSEGDDHIRLIKACLQASFPSSRDFRNIVAPINWRPIVYSPVTGNFLNDRPETEVTPSGNPLAITVASAGGAATFVGVTFNTVVKDSASLLTGGGLQIDSNTNKGCHYISFSRQGAAFGTATGKSDIILVRMKLGGVVQTILAAPVNWGQAAVSAGGSTAKVGDYTLVVPHGPGPGRIQGIGLWTFDIAACSFVATGAESISVNWRYQY